MPSVSWPESLAGTPAVVVIERALQRDRLGHSLLLHGDDLDTLMLVAHAIADRLLNGPPNPQPFPIDQHPDCFVLRPAGRARQIRIGDPDSPQPGTMRDFLRQISVSPAVATRKVGIVCEADRMNAATSNAFLKTLEEPPGRTTLLLATTRPYVLLPTIRSRCLHFRFAATAVPLAHPDLPAWRADYQTWLTRLAAGGMDRAAIAAQVMGMYGLIARFQAILASATAAVLAAQKDRLPPDLDEDELEAIEIGIANGIRQKLFAEIEQGTITFARPRLAAGGGAEAGRATRNALTAAVGELERCAGLLRVNLNESAALEQFLLTSLRLWAKRPG